MPVDPRVKSASGFALTVAPEIYLDTVLSQIAFGSRYTDLRLAALGDNEQNIPEEKLIHSSDQVEANIDGWGPAFVVGAEFIKCPDNKIRIKTLFAASNDRPWNEIVKATPGTPEGLNFLNKWIGIYPYMLSKARYYRYLNPEDSFTGNRTLHPGTIVDNPETRRVDKYNPKIEGKFDMFIADDPNQYLQLSSAQ
jgi:hypothetical protein